MSKSIVEPNNIPVAYKYRIYPNTDQQIQLGKTFGSTRFLFNHFLDLNIKYYDKKKIGKVKKDGTEYKHLSFYDMNKKIPKLKKKYPWLSEVDSISLQQVCKDLSVAYDRFFKQISGHPDFKKRSNSQSYRTQFIPTSNGGNIYIDPNGYIQLPKLKWVKMVYHRPHKGRIINATVSKTPSGEYYVSVLCSVDSTIIKLPKKTKSHIGIDMGVRNFCTLSTGEILKNPKHLKKSEKKLAKLQRRLAKKQKGSSNRERARAKVAKIHQHIANQRKDFLHKLSTRLVRENQTISLETLNVKRMSETESNSINKAVRTTGWSMFVTFLKYKAVWYHRTISEIEWHFPSSKTCSCCGHVRKKLRLKIKYWTCKKCQTRHHRDKNAAINIDQRGLLLLKG